MAAIARAGYENTAVARYAPDHVLECPDMRVSVTVLPRESIELGGMVMLDKTLRSRLYDLYAAYAEGRIDDVLTAFDDQVSMTSYAPVDVFPYLGRQHGKAAVASTMRAAHSAFEYLSYTPVFMVTENDSAAAIVLTRLRQRTTNRIIQLFVADFFRLENGRIIELREFMDSFDAVQQVLGREIELSKGPQ